MTKQTHIQIEGQFPALDRKKVGKPFVMSGKNYIVDVDGPRSAFGFQRTQDRFDPNLFIQDFHVGSELVYFTRDGGETKTQISRVAWPSRQIIPLLSLITDPTRPKLNLPWSHAYVGIHHYFANRTAGIIRFNTTERKWEDLTATIGVENIFFITESAGRLICLAEGIVAWSAIDDGADFVPSLTTGAGFQTLSLIGAPENDVDYLGLQPYARGFLSFTTKGVMRSEIIDSVSPFRHLPGEAQQTPLTSWCITKISDTQIVILSRHGLFETTDGFFKPYQPLMSEYFKTVEIPSLQSQTNGFLQIYYSQSRDELYVLYAQTESASQYTRGDVLYIKRDSWSNFNQTTRALVEIDPEADGLDFKQAFVDLQGRFCYLNDQSVTLLLEPQNVSAIYVDRRIDYDAFQIEGVWIMPSVMKGYGFSVAPYPETAGYYEQLGVQNVYKTDEPEVPQRVVTFGPPMTLATSFTINHSMNVLGPTVQEQVQQGLNSQIEVGLFRFTDDEANDQFSLITNVAISCLDETDSTSLNEDWLEDFPTDVFEDWLTVTPDAFEDWGLEIVSGSVYTEKIRGTLDGYTTFEDQFVDLDVILLEGKTKFCSCANAGIFQSVQISALEVGQSYHLKTLEINGILIGRL